MAKFSPPFDFDFSLPDHLVSWLNSKDEPVQVSKTLYCMGLAAESVFAQLKFDSDSGRTSTKRR